MDTAQSNADRIREERRASDTLGKVKCRVCKMYGGPYPKGDRPQTGPVMSGCSRCGWCL